MLIVALVLAVIGLAALVTAVVSSNEIVAWVCIGASALGVILLVVDAIRERQRRAAATAAVLTGTATATTEFEESGQEVETVGAETVGDVTPQDETDDGGPVSEQQAEIDSEIGTEEFGDAGSADETPEVAAEEHPDEVVHDEPEFDTYSDDEPEYPPSAEESAVHTVDESELNRAESEER